MLDFGKKITELVDKVLGRSNIDREAVEDLVKGLQKILLQADVDVKLVYDLSQKIRERCLKEEIAPGFTLREHTMKVVYEEITNLLGKEKSELLGKKRVMLVGLFGSGKCVHPKSLIPLSDGRIMKAEDIYAEFSMNSIEEFHNDDIVADVSSKNIIIPSFNPETFRIENKKITHLWKLKGKKLLEIYIDNGNSFSTKITTEHPFFVLRNGEFKQIKAKELNEDDFIAIPRTYKTKNSHINLFNELRNLNIEVKVNKKFKINKSIKHTHKMLKFKQNYCTLTTKLKNGIVPIILLENTRDPFILIRYKNSKKYINFPLYFTQEFAEFLGYVFGDGHLDKSYVEIVSENSEIIERVRFLAKILFGLDTKIKRDIRTRKMYTTRIISKTLVLTVSKIFGIEIGRKGRNLKIPTQILMSDNEIIRHFIKAYFDCDASPSKHTREIELSSESNIAIRQIQLLLLRFGIFSSISKKNVKNKDYWKLDIRARYAEIYAHKIGFEIKYKQDKVNDYSNIGILQGCGKQDMIPLAGVLYETRMQLGFSIGEIQKFVNSYGQYERMGLISRESLFKLCKLYREKVGFIFKFLSAIKNLDTYQEFSYQSINGSVQQLIKYGLIEKNGSLLQLTQEGFELLNQKGRLEKIDYLEKLAISDVCWSRVRTITKLHEFPENLYDFTVEGTHSFIADGIIVHNTTTTAKLAKYFQKQGLKPSLIACDYHRPAAPQQLQQLGDKLHIPVHIDDKKDPYKAIKDGLAKFQKYDIILVDTAGRDALDKELADELKKLGKLFNPDEVLLVIPADLGRTAGKQSEEFDKLVGITGVMVTKMDGTAKGGAALSSCNATGAKVKFIGLGEKLDELEQYDPIRFVSRMLGLGDLQTLIEKVKEAEFKKEDVEKIIEGRFTLKDFYEQIASVQKMGSLSSVMEMIPGFKLKIPEGMMTIQEEKLKKYKHIINSMTKKERENSEIIHASRIKRIAKGSGTSEKDVRDLLKQYELSKKMMKKMGGLKGMKRGGLANLAKKFGLKF